MHPNSTTEHFWSKVDRSGGGCWIWTAGKTGGYGRFWDGRKQNYAHRFAYELLVGPVPPGLVIDHLCCVTACVNPLHLEPVTSGENIRRGFAAKPKGPGGRSNPGAGAHNRRKTHCPHGHEYAGENLAVRRGRRICRTCGRQRRPAAT